MVVELVVHIALKEAEGAILVFCPGWFDISKVRQ
jgi:HrpA-like RNA helicase